MGKYSSRLTTQDVCKLEVKECEEILQKYNVSEEDIEEITGMIKQAYHMLTSSYATSRQYEAYIVDRYGEKAQKKFFEILFGKRKAGKRLQAELDKQRDELLSVEEDEEV